MSSSVPLTKDGRARLTHGMTHGLTHGIRMFAERLYCQEASQHYHCSGDQILTNVLNHTKVSGDACLAVCDERYESSVHWTVHIEKSAHFQRL